MCACVPLAGIATATVHGDQSFTSYSQHSLQRNGKFSSSVPLNRVFRNIETALGLNELQDIGILAN